MKERRRRKWLHIAWINLSRYASLCVCAILRHRKFWNFVDFDSESSLSALHIHSLDRDCAAFRSTELISFPNGFHSKKTKWKRKRSCVFGQHLYRSLESKVAIKIIYLLKHYVVLCIPLVSIQVRTQCACHRISSIFSLLSFPLIAHTIISTSFSNTPAHFCFTFSQISEKQQVRSRFHCFTPNKTLRPNDATKHLDKQARANERKNKCHKIENIHTHMFLSDTAAAACRRCFLHSRIFIIAFFFFFSHFKQLILRYKFQTKRKNLCNKIQ